MNSAHDSLTESDSDGSARPPRTHDAQRGLSQLQIEQTGAGSTVKYHGMYVASDALVKLLGMRAENARSCAECLLR